MADDGAAILVIKKKKGGGGDGHHGGAWKVAYADFVTAMMAFFLLMWLLSSTSEEQRSGIADYFSPKLAISDISAGGAGMFGGESAASSETMLRSGTGGRTDSEEDGEGAPATEYEPGDGAQAPDPAQVDPFLKALAHRRAELEFEAAQARAAAAAAAAEKAEADARAEVAALARGESVDELKDPQDGAIETGDATSQGPGYPEYAHEKDFKVTDREALARALENPALTDADRDAMQAAYEAIEQADENGELLQHLAMRITPEGLLIEIAETARTPLFASASAAPSDVMVALMQAIAPALREVENRVAIVGHTDGQPFAPGSRRTNWSLSAERADAARRLLKDAGLPPERFARISGAADRDPLSEDVLAPENRRIGLTLLRAPAPAPRPTAPAARDVSPDAAARTPDPAPRSNGGDATP